MSEAWPALPKKRVRWAVVVGLAVCLVGVVGVGLHGGARVQYFDAPVTRGDIYDVVQATGTDSALTTVQVGSQVSGQIASLKADFNSRVRHGEIIALIDPTLFQAALDQATADLASATATVASTQADLEKARATLDQAKSDYSRYVPLVARDYATAQTLTDMKATVDVDAASVDGEVAAVAQAKAQVKLKEAAVAVARADLNYTVIRSPIDGTVVARNVDVGQTVAASLQAPTIFTIAQDLTKMQLYAATDESDVGRIRVGRAVTFKVDAFPKETFRGVVSQIRMNATTVQNVVTYSTIIDFANPDLKLFPGMTAYVTIPVASVHDVERVPNSALRYHPPVQPDELRRLYARAGIDPRATEGPKVTLPGDTAMSVGTGDEHASARPARVGPPLESAIVWKHTSGGALEPVELALGITDHAYTEVVHVIKGDLRIGDEVVTGSVVPGAARR
jgi:HlyD family secretion protein